MSKTKNILIVSGVLAVATAIGIYIYKKNKKQEVVNDPCNGMGVWNPVTQQCENPG